MQKRNFLTAATLGTLAGTASTFSTLAHAKHVPKGATGPTLLTVSGLICLGNRGALDPALDQMMTKQKIGFNSARTFDFAALTALPAITIKPTLEYDNKPHTLKGPLLMEMMKACGVKVSDKTAVFLRAVDGYAAQVSAVDIAKYRYIVATHLDGRPMALGGLGPLWAVYDADRFADIVSKPVTARFATCPWAMYHIEVKEG